MGCASGAAKSQCQKTETLEEILTTESPKSPKCLVDQWRTHSLVTQGGGGNSAFIHTGFVLSEQWGLVTDRYTTGEIIGRGGFGSVRMASSLLTNTLHALKTVNKLQKGLDFLREVTIMSVMDHPNIVRLLETYQDKECVHMVMELCRGGNLEERVEEGGAFTEPQTWMLMRQLLYAITYLHNFSICHRDLKLANLLLAKSARIEVNTLKVADFGFACLIGVDGLLRSKVGTLHYLSPELLAGSYDEASDVWSCGVLMFAFLRGQLPFLGKNEQEVMMKIRKGNYNLGGGPTEEISDDARQVVRSLLRFDRRERWTAPDALRYARDAQHGVRDCGTASRERLPLDMVAFRIGSFALQGCLKRATLHAMARREDETDSLGRREIYALLDADCDGILSRVDVESSLVSFDPQGLPLHSMKQATRFCPITYTDFIAMTMDPALVRDEGTCSAAFNTLDLDCDGLVSTPDLKAYLGSIPFGWASDVLHDVVGDDGSNSINVDHFIRHVCDRAFI